MRVVVSRTPDEVSVRVSDTASQQGWTEPRAPGTGTGLMSLRERVRLVGGAFEAGEDTSGGWTVSAHIPLRGSVNGAWPEGGPGVATEQDPDGVSMARGWGGENSEVDPHRRARTRVVRAIAVLVGLPAATALAERLSLARDGWHTWQEIRTSSARGYCSSFAAWLKTVSEVIVQ